MSDVFHRVRSRTLGVIVIGLIAGSASAGVPSYSLVGTYDLYSSSARIDVLPDGRLIAIDGSAITIQNAVNSSSFSTIGALPDGLVGQFGPAFIRANPSGTLLAIGDNDLGARSQEVFVLPFSSLLPATPTMPTIIPANNFEATWHDDTTLFVSGAPSYTDDAVITRIDVTSLTSPSADVVINEIGGAGAGIAIRNDILFTGNGFDLHPGSGSDTGEIRAIPLSALGTPIPYTFDSDGQIIADALSANTLNFDTYGNLIVSGGDFSTGDAGFVAVISGDAIETALLGGSVAGDLDEQHLAPAGAQFYSSIYNPYTQEILVTAFGSTTVWRYAIPTPGAASVLVIGGVFASRRRR